MQYNSYVYFIIIFLFFHANIILNVRYCRYWFVRVLYTFVLCFLCRVRGSYNVVGCKGMQLSSFYFSGFAHSIYACSSRSLCIVVDFALWHYSRESSFHREVPKARYCAGIVPLPCTPRRLCHTFVTWELICKLVAFDRTACVIQNSYTLIMQYVSNSRKFYSLRVHYPWELCNNDKPELNDWKWHIFGIDRLTYNTRWVSHIA